MRATSVVIIANGHARGFLISISGSKTASVCPPYTIKQYGNQYLMSDAIQLSLCRSSCSAYRAKEYLCAGLMLKSVFFAINVLSLLSTLYLSPSSFVQFLHGYPPCCHPNPFLQHLLFLLFAPSPSSTLPRRPHCSPNRIPPQLSLRFQAILQGAQCACR